jgi:CheY-like chemotaxis protein
MTKVKKRILVADDDPGILDALQIMLEEEGYEVDVTANGETVKKVYENLPDLILLDIWMSGMDGRDICKHLKGQEKTSHIPIIMVSANRDVEQMAKAAGADGFIAKPFQMDELLEIVANFVK